MKIIDAHAHIASWPSLKEAERLILLSEEKYGVAYSLVSNCDGAEFPSIGDPTPKGKSTLACLKETLAFQSRNKERIGALMWIRPYEEKPSEELVEYIKKNRKRILAIKFHPYEEHLSILGAAFGKGVPQIRRPYLRRRPFGAMHRQLPLHRGHEEDPKPLRRFGLGEAR